MLQAVIFDMDGVIADSEPLHYAAVKLTLAPYSVELTEHELKDYVGQGTRAVFQSIKQKYGLQTSIEEICDSKENHLLRIAQEEVTPIPGAMDLIEELGKNGIKMAVASSSSRSFILQVLEKLDLVSSFSAIVGGNEVERSKPNPDIYLEAARRIRYRAECCAAIEDSKNGIWAAKNSGMKCIGFKSPNTLTQDLEGADLIVEDLGKLGIEQIESLFN